MTKELPCPHCGQDLHIPARYNAENIAQLETELADLKTSHSYLQFKYRSDICAKLNAISTSVRLAAELEDERSLRYKTQNETSKRIYELETENGRLVDGLADLATATLTREHNIKALVFQLRDIHKMALSIITNLDVDTLEEGG